MSRALQHPSANSLTLLGPSVECGNIVPVSANVSEQQSTSAGPRVDRAEEARRWFAEQGVSVSAWSVENGFAPALVYQVLKGERKCLRGQSFKIAVALGIRPRPVSRELGHAT